MDVNKAELEHALKLVRPGLATRELVEQSTSFAFVDGFVVTYNDEISIQHPVLSLKGFTGAVSSSEIYDFLQKVTRDTLSVERRDGELLIQSGRAKVGLKIEEEIKLPLDEVRVDAAEEKAEAGGGSIWDAVPPNLIDGLKMCVYSCSKDASRPALTCIHVGKNRLESCDNVRLTRFGLDASLPCDELLLPGHVVEKIVGYPITKITHSGNAGWLHFSTDEGTIISCRLVQGSYVSLDQFLEVKGETIVLPQRLVEVLDRAAVFSKRDHALDQEVEVALGGRNMTVRAKSDTGWFEESLGARYEGASVSFVVHPEFLREACERSAICVLSQHRMKFSSECWEHVLALKA